MFLKANSLVFMAAGSPAFCCKSSLRCGLYAAIRLRNKAGYHQARKKLNLSAVIFLNLRDLKTQKTA
jgi:hypothetical protein